MSLDEKDRCCGRKPLVYKRDGRKFCPRCDRSYDLATGKQVQNWAWLKADNGEFVMSKAKKGGVYR